jgi:hypothetical protein
MDILKHSDDLLQCNATALTPMHFVKMRNSSPLAGDNVFTNDYFWPGSTILNFEFYSLLSIICKITET